MNEKKLMPELNRLQPNEFINAAKTQIIIVLDNVRSMNNVGSVFRTADGFLLESIYLCGFTPVPPHRDIQKTALGATETVLWMHFNDTTTALQVLKNDGYKIIAIEQVHQSISLENYNIIQSEKYALVFGNEVEGVSNDAIALCDECIEIPQAGSKHSFNISVSMGIVCWEFFKKLKK